MSSSNGFTGYLWPSGEQQLLLEAALCSGDRGIAAFRSWRSRVDVEGEFGWNMVRLLPMVFDNLHRNGFDDPLMGRLRGVYRRAWYQTHQLFHRTAPAVAGLLRAGCDVLLLKGAALVLSYYRNYAFRPMADVDVAVRSGQVRPAIRALEEAGFRSTVPMSDDLLRFRHALQFVHPEGGEIDLHWHVLFEGFNDRADAAFRATAEPVEFMGHAVRQPDPARMLLNVVVHGVRWNEETPIRWIPDALTILRVRGDAIDWEGLVALAGEQKVTWRLALGLSYLAKTFEAPVPPSAIAALRRQRTLLERVENTVMLADNARYHGNALGTEWVAFTEYCRCAEPGGVVTFLNGYTEYLRFRLGLSGRRQIVPAILRGAGRRLRRGG